MKTIVANWKMQLTTTEAVTLAREICEGQANAHIILCPSFPSLSGVSTVLRSSSVLLGAQDLFWEEKGAYTGEVSAAQLREVGCSHVLIGHSERRKYVRETDQMINKKLITALSGKLAPILCVGKAYRMQLTKALTGLHLRHQETLLIAYEPESAIGKKVEKLETVVKVHEEIRGLVTKLLPGIKPKQIHVLYGGGMEKKSAPLFLAENQVDGLLVGGASLTMATFAPILEAAYDA